MRRTFAAKLGSYHTIQATAALTPDVQAVGAGDVTENDRRDTLILNELHAGRVDILITEDRGIGRKAARLGIADRVFTIDAFLEKVNAENPGLVDYRVLAVRRELFGHVDIADTFFDSVREEYGGSAFDRWCSRKSDEYAYVCREADGVVAFLYVKVEDYREPYHDIAPAFSPKRRLKIGTFKVELNGFKLGERLLKIVFDNALAQRVDEIYVTIFPRSILQQRLIQLLEDFGFPVRQPIRQGLSRRYLARDSIPTSRVERSRLHGDKHSRYGTEAVYVRDMRAQDGPSARRD